MESVCSMTDSTNRKSTGEEEQNSIVGLSLPVSKQHPDTALCFAAMLKTHLDQSLNKSRMESFNYKIVADDGDDLQRSGDVLQSTPVKLPIVAVASTPADQVDIQNGYTEKCSPRHS